MPLLELKNICKNFEIADTKLKVLIDINESFNSGEIVALVGQSGAGKSTLMNIIGALDTPTSGEVIYDGKNILNSSESELDLYRGKEIGFVFQHSYLLDDFTALENVILPYQVLSPKNAQDITPAAITLLTDFGLADRLNHYPKELSGGEQQRVAIARSIINSPKIILADEPTGNLDRTNSTYIIDLLIKLAKKDNITIIIVTHDEVIANKLDRIIRLEKI